ncbi:NAD(P)-dependent alcohol dehydrogenase [Haliangium sp.]|uniref:NAD(P)-dependent alcohol dehydrogenase n=1 Tax=Haliangium sp. TaxID=2663208 RepID=UPI003D0E7B4E
MKALYIDSYGDLGVMKLGELPRPMAGAGEVLVEVRATSVNPIDWKIRSGDFKFVSGSRFPKVLCGDLAGVVSEVGPGVTGVAVGDAVYGYSPIYLRKQGALAEFVAVAAKRVRPLPEGVSFEQAASLPVAALTALQGIRLASPVEGKRVLINGATGGVGHFAVQIAKARGAEVTAVCSARNAEFARGLGADEVIDYREQDVTQLGRQWDLFFDAYGQLGFSAARPALAPKGLYETTLGRPKSFFQSVWRKLVGGPQIAMVNMRGRPEDYAELEALLASGAVTPVIDETYPLERATEAFAALEAGGKTRGKVVVTVG